MKLPLSRFAPSPSLASLRDAGGGRPQRTQAKRCLSSSAALARGHWLCACRFLQAARNAMDN
jgi:hypothetical protein